jgi:selT/selW/selH-like putative selenoprotein
VRDMMIGRMPTAQVALRKSGGGVFEITVDGRLAYSKKASGRFPTDEEVLGTLG